MAERLDPLRVVYIVGKGRSGSTLLDDVLGTLPDTASTGEQWTLWDADYGLQPEYTCACGQSVADCPVWGPAVRAVVGEDLPPERLEIMHRVQTRVRSWPRVPALLAGRRARDVRFYGTRLGELYQGIAEATGATTIVDSSKWPAHVGLLGAVPGIEPWLLHLVRDPRAVAHSYRRHRSHAGEPDLPRFGPVHTALSWLVRNMTVEAVKRQLPASRQYVLRYEDFAAHPRPTVEALGAWLGLPDAAHAFVDDRTVVLGQSHLIGGNPRRFERGEVTIRDDDEWLARGQPAATAVVAAATAPLRARYGYRS